MEDPSLHIGELKEQNRWIIRWIRNKYPAVSLEKEKYNNKKFFSSMSSIGHQEVIIETNEHEKDFSNYDIKHIVKLLKVYRSRLNEILRMPAVKYVCLFKNFGPDSGASIIHSHSQIFALTKIPEFVKEEINAAKKYKECPFCSIVKLEKNSERFAYENKSFIAICPFAPRFSLEVWILPKKHKKSMNDFTDAELIDLAEILKYIIIRIDSSYNFYLHYSPAAKDNFHLHFEVTPRNSIWAGFEIGFGRYIVSTSPEEAAFFYRRKK